MKTAGMAYIFWLFGFHRFYLGRPASAIIYLFTCGGFGVWALIDLLLIPQMVTEENAAFASLFNRGDINVRVDSNSGRRKRSRRDDDD
jgi:TM2 domain-containing membrane protein YozV